MRRPPQHKIDATLRAMEKAHRAPANEQVAQFSRSVVEAQRAFERFEASEDAAPAPPEGGPLLSLVQSEGSVEERMDKALEGVKERLADMERKRMLALGAMTRLSERDALEELKRVKEHVLVVLSFFSFKPIIIGLFSDFHIPESILFIILTEFFCFPL